jgi:hypothetical protein
MGKDVIEEMRIDSNVRIEHQKDQWDLDISPRRNLLDLRLGDLWRARDLVMLFVWRDFVSVYKQTVLGPLWYLIQPLLTTIIFTFIFGSFVCLLKVGNGSHSRFFTVQFWE